MIQGIKMNSQIEKVIKISNDFAKNNYNLGVNSSLPWFYYSLSCANDLSNEYQKNTLRFMESLDTISNSNNLNIYPLSLITLKQNLHNNDFLDKSYKHFKRVSLTFNTTPNHFNFTKLDKSVFRIENLLINGLWTLEYGNKSSDNNLTKIAETQLFNLNKYLKNNDLNLYYIRYFMTLKIKYPIIPKFYGFSNALILTIFTLMLDLKPSKELKESYIKLASAMFRYVEKDGKFHRILNFKFSKKDDLTSILVAFSWFYGYRNGFLNYEFYKTAIKTFNNVVDNITIQNNLEVLDNCKKYFEKNMKKVKNILEIFNYEKNQSILLAACNLAAAEYSKCLDFEKNNQEIS